MKNYLVVGAGFSGATVARVLADAGTNVTVIDKRSHIAGNAFDFTNEIGIRIHKYGPHIFHTSNLEVVNFLSRFTKWLPYRHKVKAKLDDGRLVTLPVNRETMEIVGENNVLDIFFRPYTKKMWSVELEEINPAVLERVPIREDLNEFYFPNDSFEGMPEYGYTSLVEKMLRHPNIKIETSTAFNLAMENSFDHVFNSMSIDEYFNFCHGTLPYRSIKFHHSTVPVPNLFPVATVNFTHSEPFTRVTEWKNFPGHGTNFAWTTITVEEPCDFIDNDYERYYPVKDIHSENKFLYERYKAMVPDKVTFIGRCGLYAYLDMHQAVNSALTVTKRFLSSELS
jgi:UDP-galactopyranose mutase